MKRSNAPSQKSLGLKRLKPLHPNLVAPAASKPASLERSKSEVEDDEEKQTETEVGQVEIPEAESESNLTNTPKAVTAKRPAAVSTFKSPLVRTTAAASTSNNNPTPPTPKTANSSSTNEEESRYYKVLHTKRSNKKHKTYADGRCCTLGDC